MNGEEYLSVRKPRIYAEIRKTIALVNYSDAIDAATDQRDVNSISSLFSGIFRKFFKEKGWEVSRCFCYGGKNNIQDVAGLSLHEQRRYLERAGVRNPIKSSMRMDLVKDRVAIETSLCKSFGTRTNAFLKQLLFYSGDIIDVGVKILPMKEMTAHCSNGNCLMSARISYYEGEVYNILRHGRNSPPVPLLIIGISP